MTAYEVIESLCIKKGIAVTALEKELGFGRGSIGKMKNGSDLSFKRMQKIAEYFKVPIESFTGKEPQAEPEILDIDEHIQYLIEYLTGDNTVRWQREDMSDESKLALLNSLKQDKFFLDATHKK